MHERVSRHVHSRELSRARWRRGVDAGRPGLVTFGTAPMQSTLTFTGNVDAASTKMILWPSGTSIPITSAGSPSVPTWSPAVTMPALAPVTAPATFGQGGLTVSRGSDFAVAWQGSQELVASMERIDGGGEQRY